MATATTTLLTAEEFARLPNPVDGNRLELIRGEIVAMSPPARRHGVCCKNIIKVLSNFIDPLQLGHVTSNDSGYIAERDPDSVRGPDVAFWSITRVPELSDEIDDIAPDLAVEVLSPSESWADVQEKIALYHASGVKLIWIVEMDLRTVTEFRSTDTYKILRGKDIVSGHDAVPGFSCIVADFFVGFNPVQR